MDKDKLFLLAALEQAFLGRGHCAPNPSVGAVAVHQNKIMAQAFHGGPGSPHAEVLAIQQLAPELREVSLYVTLEPCNHWGRTPPCVDAIIRHGGISQVIFAYQDPNPLVRAKDTPSILAEHGINCRYLALAEINEFYESYAHWLQSKKPFITAKLAHSLDGKIALAGNRPYPISNQDCAAFTHKQRKHTDIILTTARTINSDDPLLNARIDNHSYAKDVAIIDSKLQTRQQAKIFTSAKNIHIFHGKNKSAKTANGERITYHQITATADGLNLADIIVSLGALGYHDVWVEAGGRLFSALHSADLVDRSFIYIAPKILGDGALNAYTAPFITQQTKAKISWSALGDNAMLRFDWRNNTCLPD